MFEIGDKIKIWVTNINQKYEGTVSEFDDDFLVITLLNGNITRLPQSILQSSFTIIEKVLAGNKLNEDNNDDDDFSINSLLEEIPSNSARTNHKNESHLVSRDYELPEGYVNFSNKTNRTSIYLPYTLNFIIKRTSIGDDEDSKHIDKNLLSLYSRYRDSLKLSTSEQTEKWESIQKSLTILQGTYYFDNDIRLNSVFINEKLGYIDNAILNLKQMAGVIQKPDMCYLASALLLKNNEKLEALYYLNEFLINQNFDEKDINFLVFVQLVKEINAYGFLKIQFENALERKNEERLRLVVYACIFALRKFDFHNESINLFSRLNDDEQNNLIMAFNDAILVLMQKQDTRVDKFIEENSLPTKNHLVLANAEIDRYIILNEIGFIKYTDSLQRTFAGEFSLSDVWDNNLREQLKSYDSSNSIQIFCGLMHNSRNPAIKKAVGIMLPNQTISTALTLAESAYDNQEWNISEAVGEQLLINSPDNNRILELLSKIKALKLKIEFEKELHNKERFRKEISTYKRPEAQLRVVAKNYFSKGSDAELKEKNLDKAIDLYKKAIEHRKDPQEKSESAVKNLAMLLQRVGKIKEAISTIENNLFWMVNKETALNLLANLNLVDKNYEKAIKFLKELLKIAKSTKPNEIHRRIANSYVAISDYKNAKYHITEALRINPKDEIAEKGLLVLSEAEKTGNYADIAKEFNENAITHLTSGLSNILKQSLERANYRGLTPAQIAREDFTDHTLESIRRKILTEGRARPQERAELLLTEAKLMEIVEPDRVPERRTVLARYCNAFAAAAISDDFPLDVSRSYYIESFTLENEWVSLVRQISTYLQTFYKNNTELTLDVLGKSDYTKVEVVLEEMSNRQISDMNFVWDNILSMFIASQTITVQVLNIVYANPKLLKSANSYLSNYGLNIIIGSKKEFIEKWNDARLKRMNEFESWFASFKNLSNVSTINNLISLVDGTFENAKKPWLSLTDTQRLKSITSNVIQPTKQYLLQKTFDEKERLYGNTITTIEKIIDEIEEKSTRFSFDGFLPMLRNIKNLLKYDFETVEKASTPRISLSLLGEFGFDKQNRTRIQVAINNERQCSPINSIELNIETTRFCKIVGEPPLSFEPLKGGDEIILELVLEVSDLVIKEQVTDINLICTYKTRNIDNNISISVPQTLNLYSESEYEKLINPFAPLAGGKAVEDEKMFFGRDEFINNIASSLLISKTSKCIVIYGQKRSGKSSVLHHLKERLNSNQVSNAGLEAFCVHFSLGEIMEDITSASFYYTILSSIEAALDTLKLSNHETVPDFISPTFGELQQNTNIVFFDSLKKFKKECQKLPNWKDKILVLMIDEFSYLYSAIKRGAISKTFMQTWKALIEKNIFTSVLVGQDVMPKFKSEFANEFGISEDKRLTYLSKNDARRLIERPIWDIKRDRSRYIGKAVDRIIEYTAGNPFYIQLFCARLVDHLNSKKAVFITEVYVKEVAETFIKGSQALTEDRFDNLLTAGDADLESIPVTDTLEILKRIAQASRNLRNCSREAIQLHGKQQDDIILDDLCKRDVLEIEQGNYRIQVQLFKEWLLNR